MRISELLESMAKDLERSDNEAFLLAEFDDVCLNRVVEACVNAANELRKAASDLEVLEPKEEKHLDESDIERVANLAATLDQSEDPELQKQASVLDELLLTIASSPDAVKEKKARDEARMEEILKKYRAPKEELDELNKISDIKKAIKESGMTDEVKINSGVLSVRGCPEHPGAQLQRIGNGVWQCEMDGVVYDWKSGFSLQNGTKIPGTSVEEQTTDFGVNEISAFDSRQGRLDRNM